jgi:hypothetical protein
MMRHAGSRAPKTPSAQKCYPCARNDLITMWSEWTLDVRAANMAAMFDFGFRCASESSGAARRKLSFNRCNPLSSKQARRPSE